MQDACTVMRLNQKDCRVQVSKMSELETRQLGVLAALLGHPFGIREVMDMGGDLASWLRQGQDITRIMTCGASAYNMLPGNILCKTTYLTGITGTSVHFGVWCILNVQICMHSLPAFLYCLSV